MNKISGIILTKNNEAIITDAIKSIKPLIDELIIIDDCSTDKTLDLIRNEYPEANIKPKRLERFDAQRNYGIELAKNNWILMIDSDEIISPELGRAIKAEPESPIIDAYWAVRSNHFFSTYLNDTYTKRPMLFRNSLRFSCPVHEVILVDKNKIKKLGGNLKHENWFGVENEMIKMNLYSSLLAKKWLEQKRHYGRGKLFFLALVLPVYFFFDFLFKKKYYKAGFFNGFFYALFSSSLWLAVIFKYKELKAKKN
ncbi:MAG: glycosyltransferase family 2 protein [Candidatus Falkowbacteria bacterium]|nr:glycosyltransferase family 2 protein [Candidatus Falkowbacteria bacterium]